MGRIYKTPFLMRKCSMYGCERQAHFTIKDAKLNEVRVICDKCAFLLRAGGALVDAYNAHVEAEAAKERPNLNEVLEGEDLAPGDEADDTR